MKMNIKAKISSLVSFALIDQNLIKI